jgi:hypothetical protein
LSLFLSILFALICLASLFYLKKRFIIVIPLVNLAGDSLLSATEASGFFQSGNIRAIILILYIAYYFFYYRIRLNRTDMYVLIFLIYLAIIVVLNYHYLNYALTLSSKVFIIFSLFIVAHHCITETRILQGLNRFVLISLGISYLSLILFQLFHYGESQYLAETFYEGGGGAPTVYIVFMLLVFPIYLQSNKKLPKILIPVIYAVGIIFVLLSVKRLSILSLFAGLLIQLLYLSNRKRIIPLILTIAVVIFVATPVFYTQLEERVQYRLEITGSKEDPRIEETRILYNEFVNGYFTSTLTGFGFDNGIRFYREETGEYSRGFHTFYAILLHNTGIIGFILFLAMIYRILNRFIRYHRFLKKDPEWKLYRIVAVSLFVSYFLQIASFGFNFISIISLIFIYLGAFIGIAEKKLQRHAESVISQADKAINLELRQKPV